ncbi:putative transcriptional regulator YdeE [Paenibacillus sp. JGP012]|uniref:GyrI-like domain-containing protein n=1 Tax=Paenibacillus sp. JGP012 TaxID=2735914 RepID=UPI00161AAB5D|nr:GyrI-like domain-containing protein [Paenibacillus sp. JGP012]MBB6024692.1 putative transcriptional regulator YdeE [Paenibacillus sp. JGP012]
MGKELSRSFDIEVVNREFKLVGLCETGNFPDAFPELAVKVQRAFWDRRKEIKYGKDYEVLFSPFMCNGIIATYFGCVEVTEFADVPEGMLAFVLPETTYVKVLCTNKTIGEGHDKLHEWIRQNGYEPKLYGSSQIEIYYIDEEADEEPVEILFPVSKVNL